MNAQSRKIRIAMLVPISLAAALLLTAGAAPAAEHRETTSRQFDAAPGLVVELENLAGEIAITGGGGGGQVSIDATVTARADSDAEARKLAAGLTVDFERRGDRLIVRALYPVDRYTTYHYPLPSAVGSGLSGLLGNGSRTSTRYQGKKVTIVSRPKGGAVTLFADFELRLPAGVGADVENAAGDITATGVEGPLACDSGSGDIRASDGDGRLEADTGSGDVEVTDYRGDVGADTGSGDVRITRVTGSVSADTGSGDVEIEDIEGGVIEADTGSGGVRLASVRGEIEADTGSGEVEGRDLVATGSLRADTGSGGVSLQGDFSQVDEIEIDAGSGGVTLDGSSFPPMDIEISTGSGGIEVDLPGLEILVREKDQLEARYQGGGARLTIDTGSGRVRVRG